MKYLGLEITKYLWNGPEANQKGFIAQFSTGCMGMTERSECNENHSHVELFQIQNRQWQSELTSLDRQNNVFIRAQVLPRFQIFHMIQNAHSTTVQSCCICTFDLLIHDNGPRCERIIYSFPTHEVNREILAFV
jgi:hypothetical protein